MGPEESLNLVLRYLESPTPLPPFQMPKALFPPQGGGVWQQAIRILRDGTFRRLYKKYPGDIKSGNPRTLLTLTFCMADYLCLALDREKADWENRICQELESMIATYQRNVPLFRDFSIETSGKKEPIPPRAGGPRNSRVTKRIILETGKNLEIIVGKTLNNLDFQKSRKPNFPLKTAKLLVKAMPQATLYEIAQLVSSLYATQGLPCNTESIRVQLTRRPAKTI